MKNKKSQIDSNVLIMGIGCLCIIEVVALLCGINGVLMTVVVGVIAAACGVAIPKEKFIKA